MLFKKNGALSLLVFLFVMALAVVAFASGGDAGSAGHGADGAHHALTKSQIMNFIWHCLNFSILAFVLFKFLKKPIVEGLSNRTQSIKNAFGELDAKRIDAERKYKEYEDKLKDLDAEAQKIFKSFIEQGEAEKEKIISQAKETAERIKSQADLYVQQEIAKARISLQREVSELAVKMSEDIISKNLTSDDHQRLIIEYLEKVVTKN